MRYGRRSFRRILYLRAGAAHCAAYHIPNDNAVYALLPFDDFGAKARMDT